MTAREPLNKSDTSLVFLPFRDQSHFSSLMKQAFLSQLPLCSLARIYQGEDLAIELLFQDVSSVLCPDELAPLLIEDLFLFQDSGLEDMPDQERTESKLKYDLYKDQPMVQEILGWLDGEYTFDPACLT